MNSWKEFIDSEMKKEYFGNISKFLSEESKQHAIYPPKEDIFNAFTYCEINNVKVVILGQDPYHGKDQAHGLSFSVRPGIPVPPSLKNIYKETKTDLKSEADFSYGCLIRWTDRGVFLLNSILTVRASMPGSHRDCGWQTFTDNTIKVLNDLDRPIVFMLWGAFAKNKKNLLTNKKHLVLEAAHPSPYSAYSGFFGCKHFSKANEFLIKNNIEPINWDIK